MRLRPLRGKTRNTSSLLNTMGQREMDFSVLKTEKVLKLIEKDK